MRLIGCILFVFLMVVLGTVIISEKKVVEPVTKYVEEQGKHFEVVCIEGYKFIVTTSGYLREKELTPLGGEKCGL